MLVHMSGVCEFVAPFVHISGQRCSIRPQMFPNDSYCFIDAYIPGHFPSSAHMQYPQLMYKIKYRECRFISGQITVLGAALR